MKYIVTSLILFLGLAPSRGQSVHWTAFDKLEDSLRSEKRPLMIFIHTDWCKYCKMQENTTFRQTEVVQFLNEHYYCLRLNAEEREEIPFLNRVYHFRPLSGYHELAEALGKKEGDLIFPTTVFLDDDFRLIQRLQGFLKAEDLLKALR